MSYIARDGSVFVSPQFNIKTADGKPWSCPDFIALNMPKKIVSIVEVSTASGIGGLIERVNKRNNQWIDKLRDQLIRDRIVDETWAYEVQVFIRKDQRESFEKAINERNGVKVEIIEEICFRWSPKWWEKKLEQSSLCEEIPRPL